MHNSGVDLLVSAGSKWHGTPSEQPLVQPLQKYPYLSIRIEGSGIAWGPGSVKSGRLVASVSTYFFILSSLERNNSRVDLLVSAGSKRHGTAVRE